MTDNPMFDVMRALNDASQNYTASPGDAHAKAGHASLRVIEAVQELLAAFSMDVTSADYFTSPGLGTVLSLMAEPSGLAQYESLVMLAGLIRWAVQETGHSEAEMLDDLAKNFRTPPFSTGP